MSGDASYFNNIETRAVKFFFLQGKASKEIHAILTETLREYAPSNTTVKNWITQLKRGDFSTCYAPCPGRPKTVTTPEIIDQIHELILVDSRSSAKSVGEQLGIPRERVASIIHEDFQCLDHPPYSPDLAPSDYHLFPGLEKIEKSPFFVQREGHCCRGDLVGQTTFRIYYDWLAKVRATG